MVQSKLDILYVQPSILTSAPMTETHRRREQRVRVAKPFAFEPRNCIGSSRDLVSRPFLLSCVWFSANIDSEKDVDRHINIPVFHLFQCLYLEYVRKNITHKVKGFPLRCLSSSLNPTSLFNFPGVLTIPCKLPSGFISASFCTFITSINL